MDLVETITASVHRIEELITQVSARFDADDDAERQWLVEHCAPALASVVSSLSVQGLHMLDAIHTVTSDGSGINVVGLARVTGVAKGTVSKTVQRLHEAGLVERSRLPDNRKEVRLRLTAAGQEVQRAHRGLHDEMGSGLAHLLARYSANELAVIIKVLEDLNRMPRDGLRFRPDLLD